MSTQQFEAQKYPYPYSFDSTYRPPSAITPTPHVLLVGDRMAESLSKSLPELQKILSQRVASPLEVVSWGTKGEGLHRTLFRLRHLKKWPPVIIYYGGSEERNERSYPPEYTKKVSSNLARYRNPYVQTLLEFFPQLSKILYSMVPKTVLKEKIIIDSSEVNDSEQLERQEIAYKLYEMELEELIALARQQKSYLILITQPLNLESLPRKVCDFTTSNQIIKTQEYIHSLIDEEKYNEALETLQQLDKAAPGNALTQHLLGYTLLKQDKIKEGIKSLELATLFDCHIWRGAIIYNHIINNYGLRYDVDVVDYHDLMAQQLGHNTLFLDDIFPHQYFDQELIKILGYMIRKQLQL